MASSTADVSVSVLSNFSAFCVQRLHSQNGAEVVLQAVTDLLAGRESVAFTLYLLSIGQFAAVDTWSASLSDVHNVNNHNSNSDVALTPLTHY